MTRGGFQRMLLSCRGDGVYRTGTVPSWVVNLAAYPVALLDMATGGRVRHNTMQVLTTTTVFTATIDLPVDATAAARDLGYARPWCRRHDIAPPPWAGLTLIPALWIVASYAPLYTPAQALDDVRAYFTAPLLQQVHTQLRRRALRTRPAEAVAGLLSPTRVRAVELRTRTLVPASLHELGKPAPDTQALAARHAR